MECMTNSSNNVSQRYCGSFVAGDILAVPVCGALMSRISILEI